MLLDDLYQNQGRLQPFGYTGYQYDGVAGMYFAQAREYKREAGRFISEDLIAGFADMPFSMNKYRYWRHYIFEIRKTIIIKIVTAFFDEVVTLQR